MDDVHEPSGAVETISLAADEEPDGSGPDIIVLQALSGDYRVVVKLGDAVEVIGRPQHAGREGVALGRDEALSLARQLAAERGHARIYVREDM
jgi:hypothetical protein